jgi:hypothetical protein
MPTLDRAMTEPVLLAVLFLAVFAAVMWWFLTRAEHAQTYSSARKTHCINGHEYTPENIVEMKYGNAKRNCRACRRERQRRRRRGS